MVHPSFGRPITSTTSAANCVGGVRPVAWASFAIRREKGVGSCNDSRVPSNHRHTRPKRPSIQPTVPGAHRSRIKEMNASPALTKKRPTSRRNAVGRCGSGPGNPGVPRVVRKPGQTLLVRLAETRGGGESKERALWMVSNWVAGNTGHRCNASIGANLMM